MEIKITYNGRQLAGDYSFDLEERRVKVEMEAPFYGFKNSHIISSRKVDSFNQEQAFQKAGELLKEIYGKITAFQSNREVYKAYYDEYLNKCAPAIDYYSVLSANLDTHPIIRVPIDPYNFPDEMRKQAPPSEETLELSQAHKAMMDALVENNRLLTKYLRKKDLPYISSDWLERLLSEMK